MQQGPGRAVQDGVLGATVVRRPQLMGLGAFHDVPRESIQPDYAPIAGTMQVGPGRAFEDGALGRIRPSRRRRTPEQRARAAVIATAMTLKRRGFSPEGVAAFQARQLDYLGRGLVDYVERFNKQALAWTPPPRGAAATAYKHYWLAEHHLLHNLPVSRKDEFLALVRQEIAAGKYDMARKRLNMLYTGTVVLTPSPHPNSVKYSP